MTKKILGSVACALLLAVGMVANARDWKNKESYGIQQYYSNKSSDATVFYTYGYLMSWSAKSAGGVSTFKIQHSTGTDFAVQTSSTIYLASGDSISDVPLGVIYNATITLVSITQPGATFFFDASVLQPRGDGQ